jgi:transcriptional regulator with XRE-family HTH domain
VAAVSICHTGSVTSIGDRIRSARERRGWSQPAVAREVGCSVATYKRYEKIPETTPPEGWRYLRAIGDLLGLDLWSAPTGPLDRPDDPRLSQATKLQLVNQLARVIADEAARERPDHDQRNVAPIEVSGMPFDTQSQTGDVSPA